MSYLKDRLASLVVLGLAVAVFFAADDFPTASAVFPRMIAGVMGFCAVLMFLRTVSPRRGVPAPVASDPLVEEPFFRHPTHFAIFLVCMVGYLAGITAVGYFTATGALVVVLALALGFRDYLALAITTVLFLGMVYGVFILIFERPLPRGAFF